MYNEQLEQLIDAALADGVLTEKEKQILFKKAQTFGIDLDEFEMVLDARLVKLQKEQQAAAPKSNKYGDVRKCPVCGALVPSLAVSCAECGYEFTGIDASSSAQLLSKKIADIKESASVKKNEIISGRKYSNSKSKGESYSPQEKALRQIDKDAETQIDSLIENFPVPNAKKDLFDLILFFKQHLDNGKVYEVKFNECLERANYLFPSDPLFIQLDVDIKKIKNDRKAKENSLSITAVCGGIGLVLAMIAMYFRGVEHDWSVLKWIGGVYLFAVIGLVVGYIPGAIITFVYLKCKKVSK